MLAYLLFGVLAVFAAKNAGSALGKVVSLGEGVIEFNGFHFPAI